MKAIICLDNNLGFCFNNRRQSRDRYVIQKILSICRNSKLYMNSYSFGLFEENSNNIIVDESFIEKAGDEDFCFIENISFSFKKINMLYVFYWNTVYPADLRIGEDLGKCGFTVVESCDFKGFSHEKITLKTYERR